MLFATVVRRRPKELREGLLLLRFEEMYEILTLTPSRSFVVIETSAYFEAYRHNLQALQELDATTFPMKSYIVEEQKDVMKPGYITESTKYDIRPLLLPLSPFSVEKCIKEFDKVKTIYKFGTISDKRIEEKAKSVCILNDQCWPSPSELSLDPSQYAAIKAALTKQFVLIQGPPGTGKTYVGLRIVQLLLHNLSGNSRPNRPILVVCYTNHALDQFLEGVSQFTKQLVRIGGRSANEAISQFQLHNLRKNIEYKKEIPNRLYKLIQQRKKELECLIEQICGIKQYAEMCYSSVLSEKKLKDNMASRHYDALISKFHLENDEFTMHYWLGIPVKSEANNIKNEIFSDTCASYRASSNCWTVKEDEGQEECDEAEVDFIESFRSISSEEFADFKIEALVNSDNFSEEIDEKISRINRLFTDILSKVEAMKEEEVAKTENIVSLSLTDRWRLYKFWLESHISEKQKEMLKMQTKLQTKLAELNELQSEVELLACLQAHVIGMTTTGAAKYRNIVRRLNPQIVLFEEAGEILESHIITSLTSSTEHAILIGDHKQLKPSVSVHYLAVRYNLNVSLFERMVLNGMPCNKLNVQHRMRPEIAALLVPHFYEDLRNHELVMKYENMKGLKKNVFFITHSFNELHEYDSKSKINQHEAKVLIKLCKYILLQGYEPTQITVLTTYSGQLLVLKRLAGDSILKGVKFTVVDNYQGEENDIILVSFVRSNEEGEIGFLKVSNRICVALSRAKMALYCVGNFGMLSQKSPVWKNIVQKLEESQAIGPSLQLSCQNHPEITNVVSFDKDFDTLREGGCTRMCAFSLRCGHTCQLPCHLYDKEHEMVKCLESCDRKCTYGHSCKRPCFERCEPCRELVERQLDPCGHIIKDFCYRSDSGIDKCTSPCEKLLSCGHQCQNNCSSDCTSNCANKVKVPSFMCGHVVEVECSKTNDLLHLAKICKKPCGEEHACGHQCQGTCSKCHQGRLHVSCNQPCKRILICGHECTSSCSKMCPPCNYPCENRCPHGQCSKKCGEPCLKCCLPCKWSCPHQKCNRICAEKCSRGICFKPCNKILDCKHPCIGLCGELCPKECRICDKEKVQKKFFGSENLEDARFVRLEDCGHIFELSGLMGRMKMHFKKEREIGPISCPKCERVIRINFPFEKAVKTYLEDIEKVKNVVRGNIFGNFIIQNALIKKIKYNNHKIPKLSQTIMPFLKSVYGRSLIEIITMENVFDLGLELEDGMNFFDSCSKDEDSQVNNLYFELVQYMSLSKTMLNDFMIDEFLTASDQQLLELSWEIKRLKVADMLLKFIYCNKNIKHNAVLTSLTSCITSFQPFREENAKKSVAALQALLSCYNHLNIDFSNMAKPPSLKCLGFSKGDWQKCPFRHIYFGTEQNRLCGECGYKTGGSNV